MSGVRLTTPEAALLAAGITGTYTIVVATLTQRLTRSRERESRVWDRRASVYEDVLVVQRQWAEDRRAALRVDPRPGEWVDETSESAARVYAKLEIYGTDQLIKKHEAAFEAMKDWMIAFLKWRHQAEAPVQRPEPGADPLWDDFLKKTVISEKVDEAFLQQLRHDTIAARPKKKRTLMGRLRRRSASPELPPGP